MYHQSYAYTLIACMHNNIVLLSGKLLLLNGKLLVLDRIYRRIENIFPYIFYLCRNLDMYRI